MQVPVGMALLHSTVVACSFTGPIRSGINRRDVNPPADAVPPGPDHGSASVVLASKWGGDLGEVVA